MTLGFSQVTHTQLGEQGDAHARDPRREVSSQPSLPPPALFTGFPLDLAPLCLTLEMKMPSLSSLWVICIPLSESERGKQTLAGSRWQKGEAGLRAGSENGSYALDSSPSLQDHSLSTSPPLPARLLYPLDSRRASLAGAWRKRRGSWLYPCRVAIPKWR